MRFTALLGGLLAYALSCSAQKPALDTGALSAWTTIVNAKISFDGNFAAYELNGGTQPGSRVMVRATEGLGEHIFDGIKPYGYQLAHRSDAVILPMMNDSLLVYDPSVGKTTMVEKVKAFKILALKGREVLVYSTADQRLVIWEFGSGKKTGYSNIKDHLVSMDKTKLVLTGKKIDGTEDVRLMDLETGGVRLVWEGKGIKQMIVSKAGTSVAFTAINGRDSTLTDVFYYRAASGRLLDITAAVGSQLAAGTMIDQLTGFSDDQQRLYLTTASAVSGPQAGASAAKNVIVWNTRTFSNPIDDMAPRPSGKVVFDLATQKLRFLASPGEALQFAPDVPGDTLALVTDSAGATYLLSTVNGKRKFVARGFFASQSPGGRYYIGGKEKGELCVYDIKKDSLRNLSRSVKGTARLELEGRFLTNLRLLGWLPGDQRVLLSDGYDIWKIDPAGKMPDVNMTNGYGYRNKIKFDLSGHQFYDGVFRVSSNMVVIPATNMVTKESGFFNLRIDKPGDPVCLTMGRYNYSQQYAHFGREDGEFDPQHIPSRFLVVRESSTHSPNCFITKDFRTFKQISAHFPERSYNWLTSELMDFWTLDGDPLQGVLYRPEDFDPRKKYPVMFYYYEKMAGDVNNFQQPEASNGGLNIPWFVSHGYIVCTPDNNKKDGNPGKGIYNSVLAVIDQLKSESFIDTTRMGLFGHSFGGFETNYLVTHSHLFAAACAASATSDMISSYGSLRDGKISNSIIYEGGGQYHMKSTIWESPGAYMDNSPVFRADQVTTPMLLMSNRMDGAVPFAQGVEFYLALSRLQKPVWLIQYDQEGHTIGDHVNAVDFTVKTTEFFDHFLKGAPLPSWMNN
jgi:hypothetical protein